jgi:imidazolonepropionase-like amidohydrolase
MLATALAAHVVGPACAATLLFENVTLIDGTGAAPLPGASVLVKGDRIDIVSAAPLKHAAGVEVIDGTGKFLMPGLIDSHIHLGANAIRDPKAPGAHRTGIVALHGYLYSGVTTVYDSGNNPDFIFPIRDEERTGKIVAPRVFATGSTITVPGGYGDGPTSIKFTEWKETRPQLEAYFKQRKPDLQKVLLDRHGVFGKLDPVLSVEQLRQVTRLANENGIRTTVHAASEEDYNDALAGGIDEFAHPVRYAASDGLIRAVAARRMPVSTTLVVFNYIQRIAEDTSFLDEPLFQGAVDADLIARQKGPERQRYIASGMSEEFKATATKFMPKNVKRLFDAGGILALGTDRGWGPTVHMELALLHAAGIPLLDLTRIATLNAAIYIGQDKDLGSIQRGKLADLLLLDADPIQDVKNFQAIAAVYKGGVKIDLDALDIQKNRGSGEPPKEGRSRR